MNNLIFVFFYSVLHFSGFTIFTKFLKISKIETQEKSKLYSSFYPLISLFFIGNLNLILNFFSPLKKVAIFVVAFFLFLAVYGLIISFKNKYIKESFINLFLLPFLISFSSYGIKFHYDSGAYHLNYQNWIYENKISLGVANLNPFYSYGSLQEYIFSNLSYFNVNLLFLFVELTFFTVFFVWIFQYINDKNNDFLQRCALFIAIFLFLDNFGYMGGANGSIQIQMVGKTDTAVAIIWVLISMMIINDLLKKNSNQNQFFLILTLGLFALQLKSNAAPLIFLILFYIFKFRKTFLFVNFQNIMLLILLNLFLVKNFLVSGCVLYPLSFTCFKKASWLNFDHIYESSYITLRDNRRLQFGENFIQSLVDLLNHSYNIQIYTNFLLSLIFIFIFKKIFYKTKNRNTQLKITYLIFILINFILFFFTVPAFRNGYGLFLSSVILFTIDELELKRKLGFLFNKYTYLLLTLFTIILFPRFFMYSEAINNNFSYVDFEIGIAKYEKINESFTVPIGNNQCWYKENCLLKTKYNNNILIEERLGYTIISSTK